MDGQEIAVFIRKNKHMVEPDYPRPILKIKCVVCKQNYIEDLDGKCVVCGNKKIKPNKDHLPLPSSGISLHG